MRAVIKSTGANRLERHFHFVVPVWGTSYTSLFAEVCLPLLMTSGNLGAVKGEDRHLFVIVTTYVDASYLSAHPSIKRLREFIEVEFQLIDGLTNIQISHVAMSDCYAKAMRSPRVVPGETYFVFLTPDSFWSENTFQRLKVLANGGYSVAMVMGLRANLESIIPVLKQLIQDHPENPALQIERLVTLALRHLHQMSKAHDWLSGADFLSVWPSHIYWWGGNNRLIARCFHMHPLMVQSKAGVSNIGDTIDGQFLDNLRYPLGKYYVACGNDDFLGVELSSADRGWGQRLSYPSTWEVGLFGLWHANVRHWYFFGHQIVYRGENSTDDGLEACVGELVDQVCKRICLARVPSLMLSKMGIKKLAHRIMQTRIGQSILYGRLGRKIRMMYLYVAK